MPKTRSVYLRTTNKHALASLAKEGFLPNQSGAIAVPLPKLREVERKLQGKAFVVEFSRRRPSRMTALQIQRKVNAQRSVAVVRKPPKPQAAPVAVRDKWAKYACGWGPDPFHTVGD